jgi:hypothetical protein
MTSDEREEWAEIVEAWAKWIKGQGPIVQHTDWDTARLPSGWKNWTSRDFLDRRLGESWRVKPTPSMARMYLDGSGVLWVSRRREDDPPMPLHDGEQWVGEWREIPEC